MNTCPHCRSPIEVAEVDYDHPNRLVTCTTCLSQFPLEGHLCPACGSYHADIPGVCRICGTPLTQVCTRCHHKNWSGAKACGQCGESIELLDIMLDTQMNQFDQNRSEKSAQIHQVRQASEAASRERMQAMNVEEIARQEEVRRREAHRRLLERRLLLIGAAGAGVVFIGGVLIWLLIGAF